MDDCFLNLIYIMKKNILLLSFLCNFSLLLSAQTNVEKGLQSINRSSAEATINFLASDELQGREAGFHGSRVTSEYIVSLLQWMGVSPLADSYFQPFDAYRKERQKKGRLEVHPDSIAKLKQEVHQKLTMRNVLGMIPGKNTKEYVIVGAHFDHLGIDPVLDGDQIYNGADDNASGVSAVLQIAKAFLASGQQPERNVIFAFWDGEEKGLLGSKYFVQTCPFLSQIKGYLNPLICETKGQVCTKYLEPSKPFSSPSQKAKITFRSGCCPLATKALAICSTADTPEALSSAPL